MGNEEKNTKKTTYNIFRNGMERHKRADSWVAAILLVVAFYYFLWNNNLVISSLVFILIFILPFIFPMPKKKIQFISDVIDWEVAWVTFPPYSKLIDWAITAIGFSLTVYGAWYRELFLIGMGVLIVLVGLIDFIIRFGFKKAIKSIPSHWLGKKFKQCCGR